MIITAYERQDPSSTISHLKDACGSACQPNLDTCSNSLLFKSLLRPSYKATFRILGGSGLPLKGLLCS